MILREEFQEKIILRKYLEKVHILRKFLEKILILRIRMLVNTGPDIQIAYPNSLVDKMPKPHN